MNTPTPRILDFPLGSGSKKNNNNNKNSTLLTLLHSYYFAKKREKKREREREREETKKGGDERQGIQDRKRKKLKERDRGRETEGWLDLARVKGKRVQQTSLDKGHVRDTHSTAHSLNCSVAAKQLGHVVITYAEFCTHLLLA